MPRGSLPSDTPIRVVGDVHGDATAFAYAAATDRFVVQLGDLTDYGPDSAATLRIMFDLIDRGRGLFLLGNHDLKLARVLAGTARMDPVVKATRGRSRAPRPGCGAAPTCWYMAASTPRCLPRRRRSTAWSARKGPWRALCSESRRDARNATATPSEACAGSIISRLESRFIAGTTGAVPMAGPTSSQGSRGARRCSLTPARARAGI